MDNFFNIFGYISYHNKQSKWGFSYTINAYDMKLLGKLACELIASIAAHEQEFTRIINFTIKFDFQIWSEYLEAYITPIESYWKMILDSYLLYYLQQGNKCELIISDSSPT